MRDFRKLICFLVVLVQPSLGQTETSFQLINSEIAYQVTYTLKTVTGISQDAKGKGLCSTDSCEFLVAVPVKSFNSGDRNRDIKMLEVTRALANPMVSFSLKVPAQSLQADFNADIDLTFAGIKRTLKGIPFKIKNAGDSTEVSAQFELLLSQFQIERPTLLTIPIDDNVPIKFSAKWTRQ